MNIDMTLEEILFSFFEYAFLAIILILINLYIYDKYVQRRHQLLINYPIIGRMRYLFETLREPLAQYFGKEKYYESRDKIDWVYKAAKNLPNLISFSISEPFKDNRFLLKHSNLVLNESEVVDNFSVIIGEKRGKPFITKSIIKRSAMSDGALSPESTKAFVKASYASGFIFNTGEGGLTSNHFVTHKLRSKDIGYLDVVKSNFLAEFVFKLSSILLNKSFAIRQYRNMTLKKKDRDTYIYDPVSHFLFRPNWDAPLSKFPKEVPKDMADIIFQMGSGLYGVRKKDGTFDPDRYQKVMRFCRATEIKLAQGAKQTGGKLAGSKVTEAISFYRSIPVGQNLYSPNRFPFASSYEELFDFVARCQDLSSKPVGVKIVVSSIEGVDEFISTIAKRKEEGKSILDFITVDSGDGGSGSAPLEMMESIGLMTENALYIVDKSLRKHNLRDEIKIISSGKVLTPDDVVKLLALGADIVGIARGFMMSGGCIRARHCSGSDGRICPIGMATQDPNKRASYLVARKAKEIANYHNNLIKGVRNLLAIMGIKELKDLNKKHLSYKSKDGVLYFDLEKYFDIKLV